MSRRMLMFAASVVLLLIPLAASAGGPADELSTRIAAVFTVLEDPNLRGPEHAAMRRTAVRTIAEEAFDFGETAKWSLGRYWGARTPEERAEFVRLFTGLIERGYLSKIDHWDGERVTVVDETVEGDAATVRTRIIRGQDSTVGVDYRMRRADGERWRVWDVVIGGVSLAENYRTQFNKIIRTSSYEELVARFRARQHNATSESE